MFWMVVMPWLGSQPPESVDTRSSFSSPVDRERDLPPNAGRWAIDPLDNLNP